MVRTRFPFPLPSTGAALVVISLPATPTMAELTSILVCTVALLRACLAGFSDLFPRQTPFSPLQFDFDATRDLTFGAFQPI